jgi:hypothetical protein
MLIANKQSIKCYFEHCQNDGQYEYFIYNHQEYLCECCAKVWRIAAGHGESDAYDKARDILKDNKIPQDIIDKIPN